MSDDLPSGGTASALKEWLIKLVPVLLIWGVSAEVRLQISDARATRVDVELVEKVSRDTKTHALVTKNTVLLESQAEKISSLEADIRELLKLLRR